MKITKYLLSNLMIWLALSAQADPYAGSAYKLERRQDSALMEVTSVQLKPHGGIINVVGDMGVYGKVYATYELTAGADRSSGTVVGEGRGYMTNGDYASGSFTGAYNREGSIYTMHNIVIISDGTLNLDVITFDALENSVRVDAYIIK